MRKSLQNQIKRKGALFLAVTMATTALFNLPHEKDSEEVIYAGGAETCYFAEGFGTGVDFSAGNWTIETKFDDNATDSYKNDTGNQAGIVQNNHSGNNESIIRLIDGVENANLQSGDSDYRSGTAITNDRIQLKENGQFSAKFTISMPDACVNNAQTNDNNDPNDTTYAREVGGDGIAFIITSTEENNIHGQAGGGIGYLDISDSIVVELDSYFNGAYCDLSGGTTAYINWNYNNQIYADSSYNYLENVATSSYQGNNPADYWNNVLNPNGYAQLSGSAVRRFDHVGVTVDGDPHNHLGISYLNGLDPTVVENGRYVNLSDPSAITPSTSKDCATRFADAGDLSVAIEEVDNRLFTFWIEYDGTNLYVSYANGNFLEAVRPANPQIAIEANANLANKFVNKEVSIGFTSAIGSSKANHTVHSVEFVNEYIDGGITNKTSYTEKYYVEAPDAAADFINIGTKKYVLKEENVVENVALGTTNITITDKSSEEDYKYYTKVDYATTYPDKYPDEEDMVKAGGSTVLYQFYDLTPAKYYVEYYIETDGSNIAATPVNGKYFVFKERLTLEDANAGEHRTYKTDASDDKVLAVTDGTEIIAGTEKQYDGYVADKATTEVAGYDEITVAKDNSSVIKLYYKKEASTPATTEYKEKYWIEAPDATMDYVEIEINGEVKKFILSETQDVKNVSLDSEARVTNKSQDYTNYELITVEIPGYPSYTSRVNSDGTSVLHQIYVLKPTYQVEYYVEVLEKTDKSLEINGKFYEIKSSETVTKYASVSTLVSIGTNTKGAGVKEEGEEVSDTFKNFPGYIYNEAATYKNNARGGAVKSDNSLVIMLFYDLEDISQNTPENPPYEPPVGTGDNVNTGLFLCVLLLSGLVVMFVVRKRRTI